MGSDELPRASKQTNVGIMRTIFPGTDQSSNELLFSNVMGKTPFKDIRVREAKFRAIDVDLIRTRVMRNTSTPSILKIVPELFKLSAIFLSSVV
jgi:peptide/nickel transport system substrate-binding protein